MDDDIPLLPLDNLPEQPPVYQRSSPSPQPPMMTASPPVQYNPHPAPSHYPPTGNASQMSSNVRYLFSLVLGANYAIF